ncbi:MAG TPA: hypothetical protein VHF24_07790 [Acidimicrobiales bacterium]|nr:hypothetical protein [Acidimicrobiales bacterium]
MSGAVLVAVDEDPGVLASVERTLRDRYARDYRVLCVPSSSEALAGLQGLAAAGEQVALVLAAQWLTGMTGSELLGEVPRLHPHAKRALLVPWGGLWDRASGQAVFEAIAHGRVDHYVVRPSAPPTSSSIRRSRGPARVGGGAAHRSAHRPGRRRVVVGRAYELREQLGRCALPHPFCLADSPEGRALIARAGGAAKLPLVIFPDGNMLTDPSNAAIAGGGRLPPGPEREVFDLVIVAAGPAGLSAAV